MGAERDGVRIAIEIKGFSGNSSLRDMENALGQYLLYKDVLSELESDRILFLAVPLDAWEEIFSEPIGQLLIKNQKLRLLIYEPVEEIIWKWIPRRPTAKPSRKS